MRVRIAVLTLFFAIASGAAAQPAPPASEVMEPMPQASGPPSCPGCDLRGVKLEAKDYTNANFSGANLANADLRGLTLDGAELGGADLTGAKLDGAKCRGCNFSRAILTDATLTGAQLAGADLQFAQVDGTHFGSSTLTGAAFGPRLKGGLSKSGRKTTFSGALLAHEFEAGPAIEIDTAKLTGTAVLEAPKDEAWACGAADLSGLTSRIHVSPVGRDSDTCGNSPTDTCATIQKGISRCTNAGCGVLVAWGEYQLAALIALRDGVNVYGGCIASSRARKEYVSVVRGPYGQPAVSSSVKVKTILQGFDLVGADRKTNDGTGTVAMAVVNSNQTHVLNSRITAGLGADGKNGDDGGDGAKGGDASSRSGGRNGGCGNANGGDGANDVTVTVGDGHCSPIYINNGKGYDGEMGSTGFSAVGGGRGAQVCAYCVIRWGDDGGGGGSGRNAGCGGVGEKSTRPEGRFDGPFWSGIPGGDGGIGGTGGGGGGGGAGGFKAGSCWTNATEAGNRGGGGGAGGCGGGIGRGGQQGGGSFGIVLVDSTLTLSDSRVIGGRGGNGGKGGNGAHGGGPGSGTGGGSDHKTGRGGPGGPGGAGGASGGGAGGNSGPSIGIVQINSTITETRVSSLAGATGTPGIHGAGGGPLYGGLCSAPNGQDGVIGPVATKRQY
jgi:uncharacterized protein YjbI with pentapeptide repeats